MWRHLLHYSIIKKSVFAQEQFLKYLKIIVFFLYFGSWFPPHPSKSLFSKRLPHSGKKMTPFQSFKTDPYPFKKPYTTMIGDLCIKLTFCFLLTMIWRLSWESILINLLPRIMINAVYFGPLPLFTDFCWERSKNSQVGHETEVFYVVLTLL